jgi:hypothetical protein
MHKSMTQWRQMMLIYLQLPAVSVMLAAKQCSASRGRNVREGVVNTWCGWFIYAGLMHEARPFQRRV